MSKIVKDDEIKYSKYQTAIFDYIKNETGHLVVEAAAGSGKTFTLLKCLDLIPTDKRVLLTAFNKDIVDELKKKSKCFPNVECRTLHGLGKMFVMRNIEGVSPAPELFKYTSEIYSNLNSYTKLNIFRLKKHNRKKYMDNLKKYVDFARFFLCSTPKDLDEIEQMYEIETVADEKEVAMKLLEWGKTHLDTIDYVDMIWLPNVLNLPSNGLQYDYIMVDECQDMNKAERELVLKCFKEGTRLVSVGDENQLIYQFSGADKESLNKLKSLPNTKCLPLSISYRCADKIVEYAQQIVPTIEKNDDNRVGEVVENVPIEEVNDGDMVLCRTNAPLVELYNKYIKKGKKAYIVGKDIGNNMKSIVNELWNHDKLSLCTKEDEWGDCLQVRLYEDLFLYRNKIMNDFNIDQDTAESSRQFQDKLDMVKAIDAMERGLDTKEELLEKIDKVFPKKSIKDGIKLSTIHKSKGLECENVYIACHSEMPSKNATTRWEKRQEQNLMYVAYTRAKNKLGFLVEEERDVGDATNSLRAMEAVVEMSLKKSVSAEVNRKSAPKILKRAERINIAEISNNTVELDSKTENGACDFSELMNPRRKRK